MNIAEKIIRFVRKRHIPVHKALSRLLFCTCAVLLLTSCTKEVRDMDLVHLDEGDTRTGIPASWSYKGNTFTFFIPSSDGIYECNDIWVEDDEAQRGEQVYDAIIQRNINMLDRYGVTIAVTTNKSGESAYKTVTNSVNAGDSSFDAVILTGKTAFTLSVEGYLIDFYDNPHIDLTQEIWDQNFVETMTLNGHLYYLVGAYTRVDNEATHAIIFNKDMLKEYSNLPTADTLYQSAKDGTWTIDQLAEYCSRIRSDVDGDNVYTSVDSFGIMFQSKSITAFLQGAGIRLTERDDNEEFGIRYNGFSDKLDTLWKKVMELEDRYFGRNIDVDFHLEDNPSELHEMFMENRVLFAECLVSQIEQLRQYRVNFGILPIPKYDVSQKNYICAADENSTPFLSIPVTNTDFEDTGYILTGFGYEGLDVLTPAFYDKTLKGKVVKDLESSEMLDIIYASKSYDLGAINNWAYSQWRIVQSWEQKIYQMASTYANFSYRVQQVMRDRMSSEAYRKIEPDEATTASP